MIFWKYSYEWCTWLASVALMYLSEELWALIAHEWAVLSHASVTYSWKCDHGEWVTQLTSLGDPGKLSGLNIPSLMKHPAQLTDRQSTIYVFRCRRPVTLIKSTGTITDRLQLWISNPSITLMTSYMRECKEQWRNRSLWWNSCTVYLRFAVLNGAVKLYKGFSLEGWIT